jgi:hypothetical protein
MNLEDRNRRDVVLTTSKTGEVLPQYYEDDNSKLITFLDKYYEFLDSDANGKSFGNTIKELIYARDVAQTDLAFLDELVKEIGDGLQVSTFFHQPRLMAKLLGSFYRSKGSIVSAESFFRGFFNEEVTIEYPKKDIFTVGQDQIGFDSQKFIQDNKLYQVFSILVKVGISTQDYENLYKKFVHPAGFHFAGEVISVGEGIFPISAQGLNPLDSASGISILVSEASPLLSTEFSDLTAFLDSADDKQRYRINVNQPISVFKSITAGNLGKFYPNITTLIDPNSFTFDDSDTTGRPDFSMSGETMDNDLYRRDLPTLTRFFFSNTNITFDDITETFDDGGAGS